jgi:hypothetical protein
MSVISLLASSLNRRDEEPNVELARQIVKDRDKKAVRELVINLENKDKNILADCIKVLYEVGEKEPALISGYSKEFISLLDSKNNRLQWGAMTAIDAVALETPEIVYPALPKIIAIADKGSVITTDHCVSILIKLCSTEKYAKDAFALFLEQLKKSPTNQLPMYAEMAIPIITAQNKSDFTNVLTLRLPEIEKESKRARVEKVIKKMSKL